MVMNFPQLSIQDSSSLYADSRSFGYQGPTQNVRLYRATPNGGGAISKSEDGARCVVTGKETLRIMHVSDGTRPSSGHKSSIGRGGHRIDASRNLWDGSGLKIDCASTDVAWGHGVFNAKILTSARNGELIMWDINKTGSSKYERRSKDHLRSINALSVSHIVHHYCITGSADGDMRVWDLRDMSRSLMRVHHPTSVRSVAFSPSNWQPLHAVVGLDNGSIYRWDLKMGQRGRVDRLTVAHTASVTTLDWCNTGFTTQGVESGSWLASGGLDRCVKVWDLAVNIRMPSKPTYTLHPSFPVRRVVWRPFYECELAVVSNGEFSSGSNPDLAQTKVGSGDGDRQEESKSPVGGDAVEVWDVRRGWIPKWSVNSSATEGGITDLVFGDSDTIWTQSSSGVFAQIDLRNSVKPIDAVSRTAATWSAYGSMTFVTDIESKWQIPYDDIPVDRLALAERQLAKLKALGDNNYVPLSQDLGTFNTQSTNDHLVFDELARDYIVHGEGRKAVCALNARVALQAQRDDLAQTWLLLGASLNETVPNLSPSSPSPKKPTSEHPVPHTSSTSASTSAAILGSYSFPASASSPSQLRKTSPGQPTTIHTPRSASTSTSRKRTPASSNASSPRQISTTLPATTTPRRPSFFGTRESTESDFSRRSSISLLRRPSLSVPGSQSLSPADKNSLRHVGEGALDDSDSSSQSGSDGGENAVDGGSSDNESSLHPLLSPGFLSSSRGMPAPSPLSRVAGQHRWTEDESEGRSMEDGAEESSSPSPRSTDSESSSPISPRSRRKSSKSASRSVKRNPSRIKSRSRSSTIAVTMVQARPLDRRDSQSSIRTVLAAETPFPGEETGVRPEETIRDMRTGPEQRNSTVPRFPSPLPEQKKHEIDPDDLTDRQIRMVTGDEKRFRDLAWNALREAFEQFAEEGDVQMCAMLSIIAPDELKISQRRASRFLESYIDLLTRRRLHTCSAYIRKHCQLPDIRSQTLLDTTIYTLCGRCKKPIIVPAGSPLPGELVKGGYSYCLGCKDYAMCAICRLPVRALFFQCSICCHGGHQACYRAYFMNAHRVNVPGSTVLKANPNAGSGMRRSPSDSPDEDIASTASTANSTIESLPETSSPQHIDPPTRLAGYPCAAGCGHICWASASP